MTKIRNNKKSLLDEVTNEQLKDLLLKGHTLSEIAYILKSNVNKINKRIVNIQDLPPRKEINYRKKRSPQERQELLALVMQLIKEGYVYREIAQKLNMTVSNIGYLLRSKGVDTKKLIEEGKKNRKFLEDVESTRYKSKRSSKEVDLLCEQIVELLNQGYTLSEVALQLGIKNVTLIYTWFKFRGVDITEYTQVIKKQRREQLVSKIEKLRNECNNLTEVSAKLGVSYKIITTYCRKQKNAKNNISKTV